MIRIAARGARERLQAGGMEGDAFGPQVLSTRPTSPMWRVRGSRGGVPNKATFLETPGPIYSVEGDLDVARDRLSVLSAYKTPPRGPFARAAGRGVAATAEDREGATPGPGEYASPSSCGGRSFDSTRPTRSAFSLSGRERLAASPGCEPTMSPADVIGPGRCRVDTAFTTTRSRVFKQQPMQTFGREARGSARRNGGTPGPGYYKALGGAFGTTFVGGKRNAASWSMGARWSSPAREDANAHASNMGRTDSAFVKADKRRPEKTRGYTMQGRPVKFLDYGPTPGPGAYGGTPRAKPKQFRK